LKQAKFKIKILRLIWTSSKLLLSVKIYL